MYWFFFTALAAVGAHQLTKLWITTRLAEGQSLWQWGIIEIVRIQRNSGAAFGLFKGASTFLTVVDILGILALFFYVFYLRPRYPRLAGMWPTIALALVLGGTTGNLIDRLRFGGVTDFISLGWWPVFNVADSCISVGVVMFAITILFLFGNDKD